MESTRRSSLKFIFKVFFFIILAFFVGRLILLKTRVPSNIYFYSYTPRAITFENSAVLLSEKDTVKFLGIQSGRIWCEAKDGSRGFLNKGKENLRTASHHTLDDYDDYTMDGSSYYYTTVKKVKEWSLGKSFDHIDKKWRKATYLFNIGNGKKEAQFKMIGALDTDGCIYDVKMIFDKNMICESVELGNLVKNGNSWWLGKMPLVQAIVSQDWIMMNVQDPIYHQNPNKSWYWKLLGFIIYGFLIIAWGLFPSLFSFIFINYLVFKFDCFKKFSDETIILLQVLLFVIVSYVWITALFCWGFVWWILLPYYIYVIFDSVKSSMQQLNGSNANLTLRCPRCKEPGGVVLAERILYDTKTEYEKKTKQNSYTNEEYDRTETKKFEVHAYSSFTSDYSYQYFDIPIYRMIEVHKYHYYTLEYRVETYKLIYKCSKCGYTNTEFESKKTLVRETDDGTEVKKEFVGEKMINLPKDETIDEIHYSYRLVD